MYKDKTFLGIIPARGGSKRLPRKNVLDLCGKPLIAWSIKAGLNSKYIDKVVVSSDDDDILNILGDYSDTTLLSEVLDLFFIYLKKRPDRYIDFYHAANRYFNISKNSSVNMSRLFK